MASTIAAERRRRRDDLLRGVATATEAEEIFTEASRRLQDLIPFAAVAWVATDPGTGLPASPVVTDGLDDLTPGLCSDHWQREFEVGDFNLFRDLANTGSPAAGLRATATDPNRSTRYQTFLRPLEFDDELRAVCRDDDATWGLITLWRRPGEPRFEREEADLLADVSNHVGRALRAAARPMRAAGSSSALEPGVVIFDSNGEASSINDQARLRLDEIGSGPGMPNEHVGEIPMWLDVLVSRSRSTPLQEAGAVRTRLRTRDGVWLVAHATTMVDAEGASGDTAVVIEQATPAEVAPIIAAAFDLTDREQQIAALVARGEGTAAIAERLFLSPHTVRDHIKAILAKVGVSSRGELVAKVYAEFYEPGTIRVRAG